jgi:hypothetical protein
MKRAIVVAVVAGMLIAAPATQASVPVTGTGTGVLTSLIVTETWYADGNTFGTTEGTEIHHGVQEGTVTLTSTFAIHPSGNFTYNGIGICACTVAGRTGTFVYRFEARGDSLSSPAVGTFTILYGDGDLATLRGHGTFEGALYTFDYHFDPN